MGLLFFGLSAAAFCQVVPPAPTTLPSPLTLPAAIAIALRQQPQQYIARAGVTQALGQRQVAQSKYYPTLTPSYQFQNSSQSYYGLNSGAATTVTTTGGTQQILTGTTSGVTFVRGGGLSVAVTQTLLDNGAREAASAEARRALDAANDNYSNQSQATILTVTQDYYQLLAAIDRVKVDQATVTRYQQTVDLTQAQIAAGTVAAIQIYQSQSDLANAQVTLLEDQASVRTSSAALKNALGVETDQDVQPAPLAGGDQLPPLPGADQDRPLDAYLAQAYADRPDLKQQAAVVQSDVAAVRLAERNAGLSVSVNYALTYQATNDVGAKGVDSQLLLSSSFPLFDAGNARGEVREAQATRDAAQDQYVLQRQQVRQDTEQAYINRAQYLAAARLAQAAIKAAQVNYDSAVASRREGVGTVLDITTAQQTLTQAQNQYVSAVYNFYIADAQLQRAIGRNDIAPTTTP